MRQFLVSASLVLLPAMLIAGYTVSRLISESATRSAAASAALYMENFVLPSVDDLAHGKRITAKNRQTLRDLLDNASFRQHVASFKIWLPSGEVAFASNAALIGQVFPAGPNRRAAFDGRIAAKFDQLAGAENAVERASGEVLFEIYIPLRAPGTDRIFAVGEFYQRGAKLKRDIQLSTAISWATIAGLTLAMLGALLAIVARGSGTIRSQQLVLNQRVAALTRSLDENEQLQARLKSASARASESHEGFLRRFGADVHDGPAQLISLALLRLGDAVKPAPVPAPLPADAAPPSRRDVDVRNVLQTALRDLRNMAGGLAVPEIEQLALDATIRSAVARHESMTGTSVALDLKGAGFEVSPVVKLCVYRFVQEGLSNAFRHGGGRIQRVHARREGQLLLVEVTNGGDGDSRDPLKLSPGLGLRSLADRVESLGGSLEFGRSAEGGARLAARLPLAEPGVSHAVAQ